MFESFDKEENMEYPMDDKKQTEGQESGQDVTESRPAFVEPKLTYVEPELVKEGELAQVTGFFGVFSP